MPFLLFFSISLFFLLVPTFKLLITNCFSCKEINKIITRFCYNFGYGKSEKIKRRNFQIAFRAAAPLLICPNKAIRAYCFHHCCQFCFSVCLSIHVTVKLKQKFAKVQPRLVDWELFEISRNVKIFVIWWVVFELWK